MGQHLLGPFPFRWWEVVTADQPGDPHPMTTVAGGRQPLRPSTPPPAFRPSWFRPAAGAWSRPSADVSIQLPPSTE